MDRFRGNAACRETEKRRKRKQLPKNKKKLVDPLSSSFPLSSFLPACPASPPHSREQHKRHTRLTQEQRTNHKIQNQKNKTSYAPLVLIQLALVEASSLLPRPALAAVAAFFVGARLFHASAMAWNGPFERRVRGMKGTFFSIFALSACCVVAAGKAVLTK